MARVGSRQYFHTGGQRFKRASEYWLPSRPIIRPLFHQIYRETPDIEVSIAVSVKHLVRFIIILVFVAGWLQSVLIRHAFALLLLLWPLLIQPTGPFVSSRNYWRQVFTERGAPFSVSRSSLGFNWHFSSSFSTVKIPSYWLQFLFWRSFIFRWFSECFSWTMLHIGF